MVTGKLVSKKKEMIKAVEDFWKEVGGMNKSDKEYHLR